MAISTVVKEHGYMVLSGNGTQIIRTSDGKVAEIVMHHPERAEDANATYSLRIANDPEYRERLAESWRYT